MEPYLQLILKKMNCIILSNKNQSYTEELKILLKTSSAFEKNFIADEFCKMAWNIGSLSMLSILQECQILSATQYILSQEDTNGVEHIQLVLSDFLESNYELLANVVTNCEFSNNTKLKSYLEDCINRLLNDFEINNNVINKNYLKELQPFINDSVYTNFKLMHLCLLLELQTFSSTFAFAELQKWQTDLDETSVFYGILKDLVENNIEFLQKYIFKVTTDPHFKGWKYFVLILNISTKHSTPEYCKLIKDHLKELFKTFLSKITKQLCLSLFIISRVFCTAGNCKGSEDDVQSYTDWYKSTICDMKYMIDINAFKQAMVILTDLIEYEKYSKFIQVHAITSISPPTLCNEIVLKYKTNCRLKINSLSNVLNMDGIILPEDGMLNS